MTNTLKIAVIPGDGIGNEVVPEGLRVLEAAGKKFGLSFELTHLDYSCERFAKTGKMMPDDGLERLSPVKGSRDRALAVISGNHVGQRFRQLVGQRKAHHHRPLPKGEQPAQDRQRPENRRQNHRRSL